MAPRKSEHATSTSTIRNRKYIRTQIISESEVMTTFRNDRACMRLKLSEHKYATSQTLARMTRLNNYAGAKATKIEAKNGERWV